MECDCACEKLPRVCDGEHEDEVTLVLHIATSDCLHRSSASSDSEEDLTVATDLSNYLAYLVVFSPKLLPGPLFDPQFHISRPMKEAKEVIKGYKKVEDRIRELDKLAEKQDHTIIIRGARLGKQLSQLGNNQGRGVWKILAEFWWRYAPLLPAT